MYEGVTEILKCCPEHQQWVKRLARLSKALAVDQERRLVALWGKTKRTKQSSLAGTCGLIYWNDNVCTYLYRIYR